MKMLELDEWTDDLPFATYPLIFFDIAMDNGPFIDDKHDDWPLKNHGISSLRRETPGGTARGSQVRVQHGPGNPVVEEEGGIIMEKCHGIYHGIYPTSGMQL